MTALFHNYDTVSQGGGNFFLISIYLPSPRAGEGRVRGDFHTFPLIKGGWGDLNVVCRGIAVDIDLGIHFC